MDRLAEWIAEKVSERRTADTVELAQSLRRIEDEVGKLKDGLDGTNVKVESLQRDLGVLQIAVGTTAMKAERAVGDATDQVKGVAADVGVSVADALADRNFMIPKELFTWRNFWANFFKRWKSIAGIAGSIYGLWKWGLPLLNGVMAALGTVAKHAIEKAIGHPLGPDL